MGGIYELRMPEISCVINRAENILKNPKFAPFLRLNRELSARGISNREFFFLVSFFFFFFIFNPFKNDRYGRLDKLKIVTCVTINTSRIF